MARRQPILHLREKFCVLRLAEHDPHDRPIGNLCQLLYGVDELYGALANDILAAVAADDRIIRAAQFGDQTLAHGRAVDVQIDVERAVDHAGRLQLAPAPRRKRIFRNRDDLVGKNRGDETCSAGIRVTPVVPQDLRSRPLCCQRPARMTSTIVRMDYIGLQFFQQASAARDARYGAESTS